MKLNLRIKSLREEAGLKQKDMAEKLEMSTSGYGFYETGRRTPDAEMIEKLCNIFDVNADYLLGRSNIRKQNELKIALNSISTDGLDDDDIDMVREIIKKLKVKNQK